LEKERKNFKFAEKILKKNEKNYKDLVDNFLVKLFKIDL